MDQWILSKLNTLVKNVDEDLGQYLVPEAARELTDFVERAPNIVLVSDFIYADAAFYDPMTEAYRRALAHIDRALAACCDCVLEIVGGCPILHKGVTRL